jgi:large-conductance mechanosensitive channel
MDFEVISAGFCALIIVFIIIGVVLFLKYAKENKDKIKKEQEIEKEKNREYNKNN